MTNTLHHIGLVKTASHTLSQLTDERRRAILLTLSQALMDQEETILEENAKDLSRMSPDDPRYDRLELTKDRLRSMTQDVARVANLPSPVQRVLEEKTLPNGLFLQKKSVPLGVVGVIYESRPNVTVDVFTLCFKSGNACILKGGKEAHHSNAILVQLIQSVLSQEGVASDSIYLMPPEREAVHDLLTAVGLVDVCIPRGSQALINFVRDHAKIPVIETGAGIVHTYFDASGDLAKGKAIITNAKTRRVSVCNALDTLIVHEGRLRDLPNLVEGLLPHAVELFADPPSYEALQNHYPHLNKATLDNFGREYLSHKLSIKTVASCCEAASHIRQFTSGHSEAIIAEDEEAVSYFIQNVDAAAVYVNASTAFTDGGEFGLGAEIAISTQKLHARGPMGLEALTSYTWIIRGQGQIRD